jgi:hypothetical protein
MHISEQYEAWNQQESENLEHPCFVDFIEKKSSGNTQSYHNKGRDREKTAHLAKRTHGGMPLHEKENRSIAKIQEKVYRQQERDPGFFQVPADFFQFRSAYQRTFQAAERTL